MQIRASRLILNKAWKERHGNIPCLFSSEIRKCGKWGWDFEDGSASLQKEGYSGDTKMQSDGVGKMQIYKQTEMLAGDKKKAAV